MSCHRFRSNEVRLQLAVLAYNLGNLWRRLGLPRRIKSWLLTSLQHRLMKTDDSITALADHFGFEDAKQLTELFRRIEGVSPSQYRLDHGNGNGNEDAGR